MGQGRDTDPDNINISPFPGPALKHTAPEGHSGTLPKEHALSHASDVAISLGTTPLPVGSTPDMSEKGAQNKDGGAND